MGTSIRLSAFKGEKTTIKQWKKFTQKFSETYNDVSIEDEYCEAPCIYTSYHNADVKIQAENFIEFKGSDIELHLWFLENAPDEQEVL